MSEIKVNSIKGVSASVAALSINNTDGTCTANITNNLSNKNLIINGAFLISQRGTSSTVDGFGTVDRFQNVHTNTDEAPTQAQADVASGTTPYTSGFRKSFKITNGNQTSGAGATDELFIRTRLEAQDIANSGWNYTSSSSYITLSFWVKSSVAQNFFGRLTTNDGTAQSYPFETGSLTADTWTKITKTISGNSNLQFDNNNDKGLAIEWALFRGTDQTGTVTLNQWAASNSSARTPDQTSTWYTTNDATFEITGVQLEVGSFSSDFQFRSFAEELALCNRYFQRVPKSPSDGYSGICNGRVNNSTTCEQLLNFSEMRATPTLASSGNLRVLQSTGAKSVTATSLIHGSRTTIFFSASVASGLTAGDSAQLTMNNDTTAHITLSAEL